jgi:hypothetical protein
MIRRTTVAAEDGDLAVLEKEAKRRGVSLSYVLREAVANQADKIRGQTKPRFGIVNGDGTATKRIAAQENAPALSEHLN